MSLIIIRKCLWASKTGIDEKWAFMDVVLEGIRKPRTCEEGPPVAHEDDEILTEAQIAVHWGEEGYIEPPPQFREQANLTDPTIRDRYSMDKFPAYFEDFATLLDWDRHWDEVVDLSHPPFYRWFVGGRLNAAYNCIDRHLEAHRNQTAIHFVPEPEDEPVRHVTYQELFVRVNELAAYYQDIGLKAGDRITIHLPMVPELPIAMLAAARLGLIHSVVFAGFSGKACGERIADSQSRVLVTMDAYWRSGKLLEHKEKADVAVEEAALQGVQVERVLVFERYPGQYRSASPLKEGRDVLMTEVLKTYRGRRVDPVSMPAEAPLFLMYTSGSTGRPKGAQHGTGGYLAYVAWTSKMVQDIHPEDVYFCMADIGWITGHSYIVYGPLALGASTVVYEGTPVYPDAGRPWRIAEELGVNIFHTSPTAIRSLRKAGGGSPDRYRYHFKHMTTVGEPIEPEVWKWYYETIGKGEAVIVDTWWQTETGGFLCTTLPALDPMKPGSAGPTVPGIHAAILDEDKNPIPPGSGRAGNIVLLHPWPGIFQTIWGDPDRFVNTYFAKYCRDPESSDWRDWPYFAGDGAVQSRDGYFRILGRIDDVINVAGHRLGTKELESAALTVDEVAEAAVVAVRDPVKGIMPDLYVSLQPGVQPTEELRRRIAGAIATEISPIARPRSVWIVPDLPKTRSGKIMRRILAAISNDSADVGDVTTLSNPEVVEAIRDLHARG
jgi:acetyl-CoA synthetase